jgi:hypothetical protein
MIKLERRSIGSWTSTGGRAWLLALGLTVLGCNGASLPSATPTAPDATLPPSPVAVAPSESPPPASGLEGLLAALQAAGAEAEPISVFDGQPLVPRGTQLCVDGESVRAYVFSTAAAAAEAASRIDPTDPTNVGTAIIEWDGTPRFWIFDTVLVLYLGEEETVEDLLIAVLGQPFARGQGRPPRLDESC